MAENNQNIQKKDNRGGKREGAGRKPGRETLSVRQSREFEEAAKALAKEYGYTIPEGVGRMFYDHDASRRDKLSAANLFWKYSVIGATEGGEADKVIGPAVFLPEEHPRLEIVGVGKDDDESAPARNVGESGNEK